MHLITSAKIYDIVKGTKQTLPDAVHSFIHSFIHSFVHFSLVMVSMTGTMKN